MQTIGKIATVLPANPDKLLKAKNRLVSDFTALVSDAEELLASTAAYSGDTVAGARSKFKDSLEQFKDRASDAQSAAVDRLDRAATMAQGYVRENPWKIAGAAAAIGAVLGALFLSNRR